MKKIGAEFFITSSENNAWLLNIRGKDAKYTPIPYCYILIDRNKNIKLFCDLNKITVKLRNSFKNVKFVKTSEQKKVLSSISRKKFIIDQNTCSIYFEKIISKYNTILNSTDLIYNLKALKTRKEIDNIKKPTSMMELP